jgi:hypothetical protein
VYRIPVVAPSASYPRIDAQTPPERLEPHEKMRVRAAASQASRRFPGVVGEILSSWLYEYEEFGFRFARGSRVDRLLVELGKPVDPA